MKYSFTTDYSEGCHPSVLYLLTKSNSEQEVGYGDDHYTHTAISLIKDLIKKPNADVHFISGGTLTNLVVLASILKPFESVIAADTGHINTHEAGAIEATGHKVETAKTADGKLRPEDILPILQKEPEFHTVRPKVVYISNSTEIGTIYTKAEIQEISTFCRAHDLLLYMDGARLISALTAESNNLTIADIANLCDIFYLGGTKCGALLGEAVVITNPEIKKDFKYHMKQRGALMAKGRVLGIQFCALLQNNLIFDLGHHSNRMATKISYSLKGLGYKFLTESETNQIFPIFPNEILEKIQQKYELMFWEKIDENHTAMRIVTSWATSEEKVDAFIYDLEQTSISSQ